MEIQNGYKRKAALFLASQGVTLFGSSVVQFAMIWYVTKVTSSGAWVSAMTVAAYLPLFVISFFSGVWADRHSRKLMIIVSDAVIAVATLALALLIPYIGEGTPILVALLIISVIRSLGSGVQMPAVNSAITQIVPEDNLMRFNGINATIQSLVQFAAPAAAGAVLSLGTLQETLFIDIATAVVGIGILFAVPMPHTKRTEKEHISVFADMKEGIGYALKDKFIGRLLLLMGIFIFLCVPAGFLATLFVGRYYGDTYWHMTLVEVIGFVGMTAGGLLIGAWGGFKNRVKTMVIGTAAFGVLALGMGIVDDFITYLVLMAVYGVALTMVQTASNTLMQENAAPEFRGRVFGLYGAIYSGCLPLGMVVFGPLADAVSMRLLMIISGVLLLIQALSAVIQRDFYARGIKKAAADDAGQAQ